MVLYLLREYVLGPDVFDTGFTTYIERWAYKHPQPADFFRTMEDVSGEDLDWYWNSWLYGTGYLDQAVTDVTRQDGNSTVTIRNRGDAVMPMEVRFVFRDGTDECRRLPVDIWRDGDTYTVQFEGKNVRTVHISIRAACCPTRIAATTSMGEAW
jgi:aminopeptidase N